MVKFDFSSGWTLSAGGAEPLPSLRSVQGLDYPAFPAGVATLHSNLIKYMLTFAAMNLKKLEIWTWLGA
ncbi:hypothetical protein DOE78_24690 [Bacillus sp. Y1]|nr:hypothetical protein DOE78_24690 [Bacillus sp. Y1]